MEFGPDELLDRRPDSRLFKCIGAAEESREP